MANRSEQGQPQIPHEHLNSGFEIETHPSYYFSYPHGDIAANVAYHTIISPAGEQTGMYMEMVQDSKYEKYLKYNPLNIGWRRKLHISDNAAAINAYYLNSSTPEYVNTEVAGDYTEGDIIWGHERAKKVDKQFLEEIIKYVKNVPLYEEDPLEFKTIGRILIYGKNGDVTIKGESISVSPYFATKEQIDANKNAIRRLFEATSSDSSLIPVFDEVLERGFVSAEKKVNEWLQNRNGVDKPFNPQGGILP